MKCLKLIIFLSILFCLNTSSFAQKKTLNEILPLTENINPYGAGYYVGYNCISAELFLNIKGDEYSNSDIIRFKAGYKLGLEEAKTSGGGGDISTPRRLEEGDNDNGKENNYGRVTDWGAHTPKPSWWRK